MANSEGGGLILEDSRDHNFLDPAPRKVLVVLLASMLISAPLLLAPLCSLRCVDHHNRTWSSSPRSVHHPLHHSSSGMPSFPATQRYMREQEEVREVPGFSRGNCC